MKEAQFPNTSQPQGRDQAHLADITMSQSVTEEGSDLNSDVSPLSLVPSFASRVGAGHTKSSDP